MSANARQTEDQSMVYILMASVSYALLSIQLLALRQKTREEERTQPIPYDFNHPGKEDMLAN